jgi:serine/threonine protein kinase
LRLSTEYLTEHICIIDFGESFQTSSPPVNIGIPEDYLAPEVILEGGASIGIACDLWALGCTLFEIRRQMPLFYMVDDRDELLEEMVEFFGKLPERWWGMWEARADFFDENGKRIGVGQEDEEVHTLETALSSKLEVFRMGSEDKKFLATPEEEQRLCKDLLSKLFTYTPGNRWSAAEVIQHDWFKM